MAALCGRLVRFSIAKNGVLSNARRCFADKMFPDPMEHATGIERRQLEAIAKGDDDPFDMKLQKRGPGTKDDPNLIFSAFDSRIVGCVCQEDAASISWMWLHKGQPRRCECGHWFKLVEKAPI